MVNQYPFFPKVHRRRWTLADVQEFL